MLSSVTKVKEVIPDNKARPEKRTEVLPDGSSDTSELTRYSVRLGIKFPSSVEQYRMLDAGITVTSTNRMEAMDEATFGLAEAIASLCNSMGECPPDEVRPFLEQVYNEDVVSSLYGDE